MKAFMKELFIELHLLHAIFSELRNCIHTFRYFYLTLMFCACFQISLLVHYWKTFELISSLQIGYDLAYSVNIDSNQSWTSLLSHLDAVQPLLWLINLLYDILEDFCCNYDISVEWVTMTKVGKRFDKKWPLSVWEVDIRGGRGSKKNC